MKQIPITQLQELLKHVTRIEHPAHPDIDVPFVLNPTTEIFLKLGSIVGQRPRKVMGFVTTANTIVEVDGSTVTLTAGYFDPTLTSCDFEPRSVTLRLYRHGLPIDCEYGVVPDGVVKLLTLPGPPPVSADNHQHWMVALNVYGQPFTTSPAAGGGYQVTLGRADLPRPLQNKRLIDLALVDDFHLPKGFILQADRVVFVDNDGTSRVFKGRDFASIHPPEKTLPNAPRTSAYYRGQRMSDDQQFAMSLEQDLEAFRRALSTANGLLRSAAMIAKRRGKATNWDAYIKQLNPALDEQRDLLFAQPGDPTRADPHMKELEPEGNKVADSDTHQPPEGSDAAFLSWVYARLVHQHGENPRVDYMLKLHSLVVFAASQEQDTAPDPASKWPLGARPTEGKPPHAGHHITPEVATAMQQASIERDPRTQQRATNPPKAPEAINEELRVTRAILMDCAQSLCRLPDVEGAFRSTSLQQALRMLGDRTVGGIGVIDEERDKNNTIEAQKMQVKLGMAIRVTLNYLRESDWTLSPEAVAEASAPEEPARPMVSTPQHAAELSKLRDLAQQALQGRQPTRDIADACVLWAAKYLGRPVVLSAEERELLVDELCEKDAAPTGEVDTPAPQSPAGPSRHRQWVAGDRVLPPVPPASDVKTSEEKNERDLKSPGAHTPEGKLETFFLDLLRDVRDKTTSVPEAFERVSARLAAEFDTKDDLAARIHTALGLKEGADVYEAVYNLAFNMLRTPPATPTPTDGPTPRTTAKLKELDKHAGDDVRWSASDTSKALGEFAKGLELELLAAAHPLPVVQAPAGLPPLTWTIRNHLGHEVGTVDTDGDPIAAYAAKVNAPSARLREAGYVAYTVGQQPAAEQTHYADCANYVVAWWLVVARIGDISSELLINAHKYNEVLPALMGQQLTLLRGMLDVFEDNYRAQYTTTSFDVSR